MLQLAEVGAILDDVSGTKSASESRRSDRFYWIEIDQTTAVIGEDIVKFESKFWFMARGSG